MTFNADSIAAVDAIDGAYAFNLFAAMKASNASWATVYYDALADGATTNVHPNATGQAWIGQTLGAQFLSLLPEWATCAAPLPLSAQITKGHALPVGTGKITVFPGVASQAQIEEAK